MSDEEVQRVTDGLDAIEAIADPEERSRAQSRVMAEIRERSSRWMKERSALANTIKQEEGERATIRGLARRLGVSPGTVQDMLDGYRGSGQRRPRAAQRKATPPPDPEQP